jgi:site-specific recombinase XerD
MPQPAARRQRQRGAAVTTQPQGTGRKTWDGAVTAFLAECRRRNLSSATLENYQWHLTGPRIRAFMADHGLNAPADMTADRLKQLETDFIDAGLSPSSIDSFHRVFKDFLAFCLREGHGGEEKALAVRGPKLAQQEPETFSQDEEGRLLAALKERPRDLALTELMLRTGLRLQEVANLTLDDIIESPQGDLVRVRQGKGRKDRYVPLDTPKEQFSDRLRKYIAKVRPKDTDQWALFLTARKEGGDYLPLTAPGIQTLFKRLSADTGIHVNPHKFRHTFATRSLSAGVDVMALQKALGHTTLAMVSRYVHYQVEDLQAAWGQRRD